MFHLMLSVTLSFLKEGAAVDDFMRPDRVVVGTESDHARDVLIELYEPFGRTRDKLMFMGVRDAEMTKYAANAMLATKISFMNEIANLCEHLGADVENVRKGSARIHASGLVLFSLDVVMAVRVFRRM